MTLVSKSVDISPEVWKQLRIHAELSDTSVRDYLSLLIVESRPVDASDRDRMSRLQEIEASNKDRAKHRRRVADKPTSQLRDPLRSESESAFNAGSKENKDVPD